MPAPSSPCGSGTATEHSTGWSGLIGRNRVPAPTSLADVPASTTESIALAKDLKRRGFVFVGPTTAYATMQAAGLVDDHLAGCFARGQPPFSE